jgi:hypothetical protein
MSNKDNPIATVPSVIYQRKWPLPADQTLQVTSHTMGFHFLAAISYRYEVERQFEDGTSEVLIDITYTSQAPEDWYFQDFDVTTV